LKAFSYFKKIPYPIGIAILIALLAKVLVFSTAYVVTYLNWGYWDVPFQIITNAFLRWDGWWYLEIAKNWYVNQGTWQFSLVFLPLYPVLIRLITIDFAHSNLSAFLVSNVSSIIATVYLFKLARRDFDNNTAKKAILYFTLFPTAYFLSAIYAEGLFLALIIASVYYARIAKWPLASFLGLFAALTKLTGLLLLPTLIVEYFHQREWKLRKADANLFWISLILVGFLIYLNINNQVTGNPFTFIEYELVNWDYTLNPLLGLTHAWQSIVNASFPENITKGLAPVVFAIFGLLAVLTGFQRRFRPSYNVFMLLILMFSVSTSWWVSVPRYLLTMFPMFILLGFLVNKRTLNYAIILFFSAMLCFFTTLFVLNQWAF